MKFRVYSKSIALGIRRGLTFVLALFLALGISLAAGQPSQAQFSLPEGFGQSGPSGPPSEVTRYGNIETDAVESPFSAITMFTIAAPTVYNRSPDAIGDRQTVEQRSQEIKAKLLLLLKRDDPPMDPETLVFEVSTLRGVPVIDVRDKNYLRPLVLTSVTEYDADFNGLPADALAEEWREILEDELRSGLKKLPQDRQRVDKFLGWLLLVTAVLLGLKYAFSRRQRQLRHRKKAIKAAAAAPEAGEVQTDNSPGSISEQAQQTRATFLQGLQQTFSLDRQLAALDFIQWLLFWLIIFAWYGGVAWIGVMSPYLLLNSPLGSPLKAVIGLLSVWFFTGLAIRICRRVIDQFAADREGIDLGDFITFGDTQRRQLRASTIAGAAKGLVTTAIALFGLLSALKAVGVSTVSVVAITSLAGLAITFGSQNLVKDLVNGFFILAEDQYAIGDVIDLGNASGLVEALNLRVTQIRSASGELITIPNSSIIQVKNLTRSWSRVAFSIDVAYQTDPDQALSVIGDVAKAFYDDPAWQSKMVSAPNVLGIDSVSHSGLTITTWIETEPAQQWAVGREFRLRVRRALAKNGINIGTPRQSYAIEAAQANGNGLSQAAAKGDQEQPRPE